MFARALLFLTVTLLCAAPAVSAAAAGNEEAQQRARMRFAAMDTNDDGVISRNEWRGSARSFEVHDWNGDGELSGDEVRLGAQRNTNFEYADHNPSRAEQFLSWTEAGFNNLDHNRDRRITVNEWHFDIQTFRRVDRNRDDALSRAEFLGSGNDSDDLRGDRFEDIDVNNNGRIERREWYGSADTFDWLDRNNDGVLTRAEVVGQDVNRPMDQFASLDINNNGTLSRDEWHWSRISFNDRDVNRDGVISRREFTATGGAPSSTPAAGGNVVINPQVRWTDTGLNVRAGDVLSFRADGQIQMSTNPEDIATPAGARSGRTAPDAPIASAVAGALIARFGDSAPVLIGNRGTLTAPVSGRLYLGVNDDHLLDNQGEYRVHVEARGRTTR